MLKLKDNELCPCGSGRIFSKCCKGNLPKIKESRKPPEVQIMESMRSATKKCCMHPDKANCKGKIKNAHALQNNKIISLLAGTEHHVYLINPKKQPMLIPMPDGEVVPIAVMSKTSANNATTETCFCYYHDNVAFYAIEKGAPDFDESNEEMKFIYAYIAPNFDMNGNRIKHTKKGVMHRIAITVFPENMQSWVLMSCLDSEKHLYENLFDQMQSSSINKIKFYLNMMLPLYSENMVLSMSLWESWDEETQLAYTQYANLNGKHAVNMSTCIGLGLKKVSREKTGKAYDAMPKINLFI